MSALALRADAIRKTFRRGPKETVVALDGVSFSAQTGSLSALVGPDGAGKTTLLRLATGLLVARSLSSLPPTVA